MELARLETELETLQMSLIAAHAKMEALRALGVQRSYAECVYLSEFMNEVYSDVCRVERSIAALRETVHEDDACEYYYEELTSTML